MKRPVPKLQQVEIKVHDISNMDSDFIVDMDSDTSEEDEKDEKICLQSKLLEELKKQNLEQEEVITALRRDCEVLQEEKDAAKNKEKEVVQALEEHALNYDQKRKEVEAKCKEIETLGEENAQKQMSLSTLEGEIKQLQEELDRKKLTIDRLALLISDLSNGLTVIGSSSVDASKKIIKDPNQIEEGFPLVKDYISKKTNKRKNMIRRNVSLGSSLGEYNARIGLNMLSDYRTLLKNGQARLLDLQKSMTDIESGKKKLAEQIDQLVAETIRLGVSAQFAENGNITDKAGDLPANKVSTMRQEIVSKHSLIADLKQETQRLAVLYEEFKTEFDTLKNERFGKYI